MSIVKRISIAALLALIAAGPVVAQEGAAKTAGGGMAPLVEEEHKPMMPDVISSYGGEIDDMFWGIFWLTGVTFVIVEGLMVIFLIKYRHREGRTKAVHIHGSHKLEIVWTAGTAIILVFLGFWQTGAWSEVKHKRAEDLENPLRIRVYGEQFGWFFNYAGADGKFEVQRPWDANASAANPGTRIGLDDPSLDVTTLGDLVVPVDTDVILQLNSHGKFFEGDPGAEPPVPDKYVYPVLHSFFSPHLRLKQDLVPFHPGSIWFHVLKGKEGTYEIACAELCGEGHYTMRADFRVVSKEKFEDEMGFKLEGARPDSFPEALHMDDRPVGDDEEE